MSELKNQKIDFNIHPKKAFPLSDFQKAGNLKTLKKLKIHKKVTKTQKIQKNKVY